MSTWFLLNISSVFVLAGAELCQQRLFSNSGSIEARTSAIVTFFLQALTALVAVYLVGAHEEMFSLFTAKNSCLLLVVSLIGSVALIFYVKSFQVKSISFSLVFVSWSAVISTILGIIFFGESTSSLKFLGMAMVLGAVFLVNFGNLHLEKNHLYALIAGALFGISYTIDKALVINSSPLIYTFWCFLLVAFFGMLQKPFHTIKSIKKLRKKEFALMSLSGFAYFVFNYLTFSTYKLGAEVGRVDAINNSQVFVVIAVEYFLFKQSEGIGRKIIAALLAFTGVMILGVM